MPVAVDIGDLDTKVRFERPVRDTSADGAGSGTWEPVKTVWASLVDVMPSRSETTGEALENAVRRTRVRTQHMEGISSAMRIAVGKLHLPDNPMPAGRRYLKITDGPVVLGNREWLEMMAAEHSTEGGGA